MGLILIGITASIWIGAVTDLSPTASEILYEHVNTGDTGVIEFTITNDNVALQTFTASSNHHISRIKLKVWINGAGGTNLLTVRIYLADGTGDPTGSALSTDTFAASSLSGTPGTWISVPVSPPLYVDTGLDYDIVLSYSTLTSEAVIWRVDDSSSSGNHFAYSTDDGVTWIR